MVSSTNPENGEPAPAIKASPAESISPGNYRLVGWDMDTTGKKLIDEICQIAGYTPNSSFAQYVMPFKNLSPPARKRHNLKIFTIGRYRMLKNSKTNKVLKTKSDISAIIDFLSWLETVKGDAEDGIILVHHESRNVNPLILLDSLIKYKLLDRFKKTVKGWVNGFDVANSKCANTLRAFSLRTLSRVLLNQEEECDNASDRARVALQIIQYLSNNEKTDELRMGTPDSTSGGAVDFIREFVQPMNVEEKEYEVQKLVLERQFSMKPIFKPLQMTRRERQHTSPLRRLLAEANIDYTQLKEAWTVGQKEALEKLIKEKVAKATAKEVEDLLFVLEGHFDPEKEPKIKDETEQRKKGTKKSPNKEKRRNITENVSPDTTMCSTIKVKGELSSNDEIVEEKTK